MKIEHLFKLIVIVIMLPLLSNGQAKKPTIMVVPSDNWCITNGYVLDFDNQGTHVVIPDYKRAFQESSDLLLVVSKLNGLMADRGFPLKNMESEIKSISQVSALDAMRNSKSSGAEVVKALLINF
ncbi:DUF6175 family protein [Thalassobellus suaedae]|uniref:DUF6175 family protein n=1 Tax=Thalassobellus suaedae TaxID=3074124 RepID=A0ABY9XQE7_9FLAO|nr:DUF6175 family protein [Flavobacteriaceae bacterium HL-DH14]